MKITFQKFLLFGIWSIINLNFALAQGPPTEKFVKVQVTPDHNDWTYKTGEKVNFAITVLQNNAPVNDVKIRYEISQDMMDPLKKDTLTLRNGTTKITSASLKDPGFLRCRVWVEVNDKEYEGMATAAFNPLQIQPTTDLPSDFVAFWENAKKEAAKLPLESQITLIPERSTEKVNVFHISFQNFNPGSRFYGILCVPKNPGKYPAILKVPGAGARAYNGDIALAEKGIITLEVGIHGVPVNMENFVYQNLMSGPLNGYFNYNLDDKDKYYFKRVYLGCVRAIDFIQTLPEYDGEKLAVMGGSQGGALSITTAALDSRVKWLVAYYPALSDLTGYLKGRAGGWPHMFSPANKEFNVKDDKIATSKYYDVVNFARQLKIPGYYSWGFNDIVCPPTSLYSVYNVIQPPKNLLVVQQTGHWTFPEQHEITNKWLLEQLGVVEQNP
ncbi:acetylxylan esterase [soil metagenome]